MYRDALSALRRYHEAQASGLCADEVERLRKIADSQFKAIADYILDALSDLPRSIH